MEHSATDMEQGTAVYIYLRGHVEQDQVSRCLVSAGFSVRRFDSRDALLQALAESHSVAIATQADSVKLEEVERHAILAAMRRFRNNRSMVAQHLGIGRTTLYRKLKSYQGQQSTA